MLLPLVIAGAIALALLALAGVRLRAARSHRGLAPPVTEAEARAHALPLTKSVLSVGPSSHEDVTRDVSASSGNSGP
ncbi:MAG TPA: hypothetical protein VEF89_15760 [Solirubrobacteraceae bacterium]|nr:hypothetical protein [Solirubrobacteraceae bacterium]